MTSMNKRQIQDLSDDVLIDNLFPNLSAQALLRLAQTCKLFDRLINGPSSQPLWARKLKADFNFPIHNSARSYGWKEIYKRLSNPAVFVWGAKDKGRLTIRPADQRERYVVDGGVHAPMRLWFKSRIVDIVSGGWSFHALDSDGRVHYWGTLDATRYAGYDAKISDSGVTIPKPTLVDHHLLPNRITNLDCGRSHALALDEFGNVWQWNSWGRILNIRDKEHKWGWVTGNSGVKSISAGWQLSTILTNGGDAYIWWDLDKSFIDEAASKSTDQDKEFDACSFRYEIDTIKLPWLPRFEGEEGEPQVISQIAAGDNFVIALSTSGRVYKLDVSTVQTPPITEEDDNRTDEISGMSIRHRELLSQAFISGKRSWRYLPYFSSISHIRELPEFSSHPVTTDDAKESESKDHPFPLPSDNTKIQHISAHFQHFVAYSGAKGGINLTGQNNDHDPDSIVLIGKGFANDGDLEQEEKPSVIQELQGLGVIRVTIGDYHFGALTSTGKLYVWGTDNSGCLGLGQPLNTSPQPSTSGPQPPTPHPDFTSNLVPLPGFRVPGRHGPVLRPFPHTRDPQPRSFHPTSVKIPQIVHFPGAEGTQDGIVFSVAFAGHHSSALVIYPHDGTKSDEKQKPPEGERWCDEDWEDDELKLKPASGHPLLLRRGRGRGGVNIPIRLGFPARGMMRGGGES